MALEESGVLVTCAMEFGVEKPAGGDFVLDELFDLQVLAVVDALEPG